MDFIVHRLELHPISNDMLIFMSPTIISIVVLVLVNILPLFGVNYGTEQLTPIVEGVVTIVAAVVAYVRHLSLKKKLFGEKNVNIVGGLKKN